MELEAMIFVFWMFIAQETVLKALWGRKSKQLNIQKTKILTSGPITSWQIDGETMEIVRDFIFLGSKITATMKSKEACSLKEKLWQT